MTVCYLFFSFVGQLLTGSEISSVIRCLLCLGEWLIASLLSAFLPFQCLFTDSLH
jgi:hypothetical protein